MDRPDNYRTGTNLNVVAKYRDLIKPGRSPNGYVLRNMALLANHAALVDYDAERLVSENCPFPNLRLVGNNPSP